ncbi:hypothetical protein [Isoptericola sp. AK164]|uniref:hypothetical protein n=1 Tax=Isoptericola sp. AK164 TaxID=3024246 RepID=UPI002418A570|nr:hypothetical protein [Isoptericola sp. AK164]
MSGEDDAEQVLLADDYGVRWPLWTEGEPAAEDRFALTAPVRRRLRAWAAEFNTSYHHMTGWPRREQMERHRAEGIELYRALRAELVGVRVRFAYWEVNIDGVADEGDELVLGG